MGNLTRKSAKGIKLMQYSEAFEKKPWFHDKIGQN